MLDLRKDYPNTTKGMSNKWVARFERSSKPEVVERLFDYLEEKFLEVYKGLDPLNEDVNINICVYSKNYKNYFHIYLEEIQYLPEYGIYEGIHIYPISLEVEIKDYYLNNDEIRTQEKLEDFLANLPEDLDQCLL